MTIHRILGVMVIGAGVCALVFKGGGESTPIVFLAVGMILAGINQVIRA